MLPISSRPPNSSKRRESPASSDGRRRHLVPHARRDERTDVYVPSRRRRDDIFRRVQARTGTGQRACNFKGRRLRLRFSVPVRKAQLFVSVAPRRPFGRGRSGRLTSNKTRPGVLSPGLFSVSGATGSGKRAPFLLLPAAPARFLSHTRRHRGRPRGVRAEKRQRARLPT